MKLIFVYYIVSCSSWLLMCGSNNFGRFDFDYFQVLAKQNPVCFRHIVLSNRDLTFRSIRKRLTLVLQPKVIKQMTQLTLTSVGLPVNLVWFESKILVILLVVNEHSRKWVWRTSVDDVTLFPIHAGNQKGKSLLRWLDASLLASTYPIEEYTSHHIITVFCRQFAALSWL